MPGPVVLPPAPTGFGDLALALEVIRDKDELKKRMDAYLAVKAEADAAVKQAGGAEKVKKHLAEMEATRKAIDEELAAAQAKTDEAQRALQQAKADGEATKAAAKAEAASITDAAKADAKERNAKCLYRENMVGRREDAATEAERVNEARSAEHDRRDAELNARDAAVTLRENKIKAMMAA